MKTFLSCLCLGLLAMLVLPGCSDSDLPEPAHDYYKVKLYDDTLPDPRNHSTRIAASANGRLLMTYGNTYERWIVVNGAFLLAPPPANVWMLTDNEGNLIKRDTLPTGLAIGDIMAMPDNSFLIVTFIGDFAFQGSYGGVQMMRIDPNGVMGPVDTLDLPTQDPVMILGSIHLSLSQNGNPLLYFLYSGASGFGGAFIGEMNLQGSFLWQREFTDYTITHCIADGYGGYLLSGKIFDLMTYSSDGLMMRIDGTGNTIWTRVLDLNDLGNGLDNGFNQICRAESGKYYFNYGDFSFFSAPQYTTHVYKINLEGDLLDSAVFGMGQGWIVPKDNGVFLLSSIDAVYGNLVDQFNSTYAILDANLDLTTNPTPFQDQTTDMMNDVCVTSDGKVACFGITQCYNKRYYKPQLILLN